jgi:N6-L-threonylcarbamoyladenine synthase
LQKTIIDILMQKLLMVSEQTGIKSIALAGGVSANSGLRNAISEQKELRNWKTFIPPFSFTTDNAAMIAINGYFKYMKGHFVDQDVSPQARMKF